MRENCPGSRLEIGGKDRRVACPECDRDIYVIKGKLHYHKIPEPSAYEEFMTMLMSGVMIADMITKPEQYGETLKTLNETLSTNLQQLKGEIKAGYTNQWAAKQYSEGWNDCLNALAAKEESA